MMKLVIGFDEIGLDNGFTDFDQDDAFDKLGDFLDNQFPNWDKEEAFNMQEIEFDFPNMEIHIQMKVI